MNDFWLLGVVGGSAGAALGFPIVAKRERRPGLPWTAEALLGVWLLMIGVGMILIGLRHGVIVTGGANRVAEHLGNVLNLLAWPVLVTTAKRGALRPATWLDSPTLNVMPAVAYLVVAVTNGGHGVRFIWILPLSIYSTIRLGHIWFVASKDAALSAKARGAVGGLAVVGLALAGAQTLRTFLPWVTPLREIVPLAAMGALVWIGGRVSGYVVSFRGTPPRAANTSGPRRYTRSGLTSERAEELLRDLDVSMRDGMYRRTDVSLPSIADRVGVSPHLLSQALNQYAGQSLNDYLTSWRVAHAKRELLDPANDCYTIEAIATRSGFASRAAFYRAFRDTEGITPTEFRRKNLK